MSPKAKNLEGRPSWVCLRCGYRWIGVRKDGEPKMCPNCCNPCWNKPRTGRWVYERCPTCGRLVRVPRRTTESREVARKGLAGARREAYRAAKKKDGEKPS